MASIKGELRRLRELRERLQAWLRDHGDDESALLKLSADEVRLFERAVGAQEEYGQELQIEARALLAFQEAKPSDRFAAYARARGIDPTEAELREKYPTDRVVRLYVAALDKKVGGLSQSFVESLAHPERPSRGVKLPPLPRAPEDALHSFATMFGFPSDEACRRFLIRAREEVRADRSGWRAAIDPGFPVPRGS